MTEDDDRSGICNANEEFWDDLLAYIKGGKVIPVLGRELITVTIGDQEVPLYRAIAEGLLKKYGLADDRDVALRPYQELNDAVAALIQRRSKRVQDLYRPINDLLISLQGQMQVASEALRALAAIPNFDLFITTTFDDLLINTIDLVRSGGEKSTIPIVYSPKLGKEEQGDILEMRPPDYHAVFYLFGRASDLPFTYAIHDEDTLEFLYNLLNGRGIMPERMITEARNRNLLLIGCTFADWMSPFFIRLSNQIRLSSDQREKKEFLVGKELFQNKSLTIFLERFSQNTLLFSCDAREFIQELARRWGERHPPAAKGIQLNQAHAEAAVRQPEATLETTEIFISYSRTDLAAAQELYAELKLLSPGLVWFDKEQLKPGDEWDPKIMSAIKHCRMFLPLLSSNTASDVDGYFPEEWKAAVSRSEWFPDYQFKIIPVILGVENDDKVKWIPKNFRKYQFGYAPGGHMNEDLRRVIEDELHGLRQGRPS